MFLYKDIFTVLNKRFQLIFLSWAIYGSSILLYTYIPYYIYFLRSEHLDFYIQKSFLFILCIYSVYILFFKKDFILKKERIYLIFSFIKKSTRFLRGNLREKIIFSSEEKTSFLLFLVKFFFIPLMVVFAINNFLLIFYDSQIFSIDMNKENIFRFIYLLLLNLILFIDVLYFLFGYIIESRSLHNTVISVDSTLSGWFLVLVCYPPFNGISYYFLGWHTQNFRDFGDISINIVIGGIALFLMSFYLWATISLGAKASNLTNRGIVSRGAYRFVRHPAYAAKNLAWWIMGFPLIFSSEIVQSFSGSTFLSFISNDFLYKILVPLLSLSVWSFIYYLRAVTEERHLSQDPSYRAYMEKVPYRFIPKVW